MNGKKCFYCFKDYIEDTEHVFPDGLGGQKLYMPCVCGNCNNEFSKLERELYQKGIPALIRSVEGVTKQKNQNKPTYFKSPILFIFDEENKIVYEANQNNEIKISLKPQIIEIKSKFYIEASSEKEVNRLINKITKWRKDCLIMISIFSNENNKLTSYIKFQIDEGKVSSKELKSSEKIKNALILEITGNHELSKYLRPRIFLDNENNLKIRAKSFDESIYFIKKLLIFISKPVKLRSFSKAINDNGIVYVGQNFDPLKNERAMVKIMLNCLLYYFPKSKNSLSLESVRLFVKNGKSDLKRSIEKTDKIKDSLENTHNIFFYQYENDLSIRLSLFNGQICYIIFIEHLKILPNMDYNRLVIDFKKRLNRMEKKNEFLMSFAK